MSELLTAVREMVTSKTPKWARTADGIVHRWEKRYTARTLSALHLSDRLKRLFVMACCRSVASWATRPARREEDHTIRQAIDLADEVADGTASSKALDEVRTALDPLASRRFGREKGWLVCVARRGIMPLGGSRAMRRDMSYVDQGFLLYSAGLCLVRAVATQRKMRRSGIQPIREQDVQQHAEAALVAELTRQGQLLAGIVGPDWNLAPEWRTDTAVQIARGIYENREFGAMPILADALQDAGCGDELWLTRMRDPNWPWCRGCHVLDSLLPELVHTGV